MMAAGETTAPPRRVDVAGAADAVDTKTLGGRMAFARMRMNMTQKELAEKIKNKNGTSKSRATIVQYENDNILPPIDVIEVIAEQLKVSPSYIAFGEHVVEGISHKDVKMVSFPEITFGKDGKFVSSTMAYSEDRLEELGIPKDAIVAYVMPHDAFGVTAGDLLITDTSVTQPTDKGGLYVIETQSGMELIRVHPHFGSAPRKDIDFNTPDETKLSAKASTLTFLGAVVSTVRSARK